ncbi:thermonuclease family protein [Microcoleus sp. bin38.metabat.b11b12b14.051]|uniref:thermonuclease family protein n=1 Tax=Microcoleus sp. bin38.metabat.b11b12b14.051 TaxID=2742709 RepID=UPI0025ED5050|nr:thermonuclease family protein [Microcoleus sp. bin38.metabat.b11b12b14.051]
MNEPIVVPRKFLLDADTFQFSRNKKTVRTRAAWIDTPEIRYKTDLSQKPEDLNQWEWGGEAKTFLLSLIRKKTVCLAPIGLDIFGRTIADWYLCDSIAEMSVTNNIQVILAAAGLAVNVPPNNSGLIYQAVVAAKNQAQNLGKGFWADDDFVLPYIWKANR